MDEGCLHEIFERHVDTHPHDTALICGDRRLSYLEVERRANRLAWRLRSLGAGPGRLVALYLERSEKPIIAMLAILKAGAGYVPIDPAYPPDRIRHILGDADIELLVTESKLAERVESHPIPKTLTVDAPTRATDFHLEPETRPERSETEVGPTDVCYIIYTSGTTGRPKGIVTEHRNVVAFAASFKEVCGLGRSDRVYQGFSLGFDGSVEEIWMAFSSGATLVVGSPELARLGEETARFMRSHGVTFFSTVPTFLSMINEDVPSLRCLVVSGEPCPPDLVQKWARPGRRMLNVYGPTETTVNATFWECVPHVDVKIGRALPGYETYVLNEALRPVTPGESGELYIGGPGIARGYLNQPELTRKHFVRSPFEGNGGSERLYRTGDLVREDSDGELFFLGRNDGQVKVRGYRIELAEIESALRDHPHIDAAAVKVIQNDGLAELAAYVRISLDGGSSLDRTEVLDRLRERLPPYMIPGFLDVMPELPTLASGKVDRSRLPKPSTPLLRAKETLSAPRDALEQKIHAIWKGIFKTEEISIDDDFFQDLRGYSLLAAQLISRLRLEHGIEVALRDVYSHPTIARLATHIRLQVASEERSDLARAAPSDRTRHEGRKPAPAHERVCCVILQTLTTPLLYGLLTAPLILSASLLFRMSEGSLGELPGIALLVAIVLFWYPLGLVLSIAFKWLVVGRYRAEAYPLWSLKYYRFWLVNRIQQLSGVGLLSGTPVMGLYYRLMGAKVGPRSILDTPFCSAFDLVHIGDDSCVGSETHLLGYRIESGQLHFGRVDIGHRCFVGIHSVLGLDVCMQDDSRLGDLSLLADGERLEQGTSHRGSPAEPGPVPVPALEDIELRRHPVAFGLLHLLLIELLGLFLLSTLAPGLALVIGAFTLHGNAVGMVAVLGAVPLSVICFCLFAAALKAIVLPRAGPGTHRIESWYFVRKWFIDALMALSRGYMRPLYTTIYLPSWLRSLGARVGRRAEISTVSQVSPELIDISDESFFADGSIIGGRHFHRGMVEFSRNRIGRRSFIGNNAILPIGKEVGENCLIGVLSVPPQEHERTPDGSEWLGSPSFPLPFRRKVEGFDSKVIYTPTRALYAQRLWIDAIRILIPFAISWFSALGFYSALTLGWLHLPGWAFYLLSPGAAAAIAGAAALCVVLVKIAAMGRFEPVIKPLWCRYVWWNEVVNGAYETIGAPALAPWLGTLAFNAYMRLMGCQIGKWSYLGTTLFSEFDLVHIGDHVALNAGVVVQNHLFEDRIMKSSHLKIDDGCSVGNMAVILYDTEMGPRSTVGPLSLLMKGEQLPEDTHWIGVPTRRRGSS
jgi:non-ribosomal peptide synthetase-like protein